jgi:hypothetical protein
MIFFTPLNFCRIIVAEKRKHSHARNINALYSFNTFIACMCEYVRINGFELQIAIPCSLCLMKFGSHWSDRIRYSHRIDRGGFRAHFLSSSSHKSKPSKNSPVPNSDFLHKNDSMSTTITAAPEAVSSSNTTIEQNINDSIDLSDLDGQPVVVEEHANSTEEAAPPATALAGPASCAVSDSTVSLGSVLQDTESVSTDKNNNMYMSEPQSPDCTFTPPASPRRIPITASTAHSSTPKADSKCADTTVPTPVAQTPDPSEDGGIGGSTANVVPLLSPMFRVRQRPRPRSYSPLSGSPRSPRSPGSPRSSSGPQSGALSDSSVMRQPTETEIARRRSITTMAKLAKFRRPGESDDFALECVTVRSMFKRVFIYYSSANRKSIPFRRFQLFLKVDLRELHERQHLSYSVTDQDILRYWDLARSLQARHSWRGHGGSSTEDTDAMSVTRVSVWPYNRQISGSSLIGQRNISFSASMELAPSSVAQHSVSDSDASFKPYLDDTPDMTDHSSLDRADTSVTGTDDATDKENRAMDSIDRNKSKDKNQNKNKKKKKKKKNKTKNKKKKDKKKHKQDNKHKKKKTQNKLDEQQSDSDHQHHHSRAASRNRTQFKRQTAVRVAGQNATSEFKAMAGTVHMSPTSGTPMEETSAFDGMVTDTASSGPEFPLKKMHSLPVTDPERKAVTWALPSKAPNAAATVQRSGTEISRVPPQLERKGSVSKSRRLRIEGFINFIVHPDGLRPHDWGEIIRFKEIAMSLLMSKNRACGPGRNSLRRLGTQKKFRARLSEIASTQGSLSWSVITPTPSRHNRRKLDFIEYSAPSTLEQHMQAVYGVRTFDEVSRRQRELDRRERAQQLNRRRSRDVTEEQLRQNTVEEEEQEEQVDDEEVEETNASDAVPGDTDSNQPSKSASDLALFASQQQASLLRRQISLSHRHSGQNAVIDRPRFASDIATAPNNNSVDDDDAKHRKAHGDDDKAGVDDIDDSVDAALSMVRARFRQYCGDNAKRERMSYAMFMSLMQHHGAIIGRKVPSALPKKLWAILRKRKTDEHVHWGSYARLLRAYGAQNLKIALGDVPPSSRKFVASAFRMAFYALEYAVLPERDRPAALQKVALAHAPADTDSGAGVVSDDSSAKNDNKRCTVM